MKAYPWHVDGLRQLTADPGRMPHALLVHGPRGIGKEEFARALAATLLCEQRREGLACGQCPSCGWFGQGNHPDYREVFPEADAEDDPDSADGEGPRPEGKKSLVIKVDQIRAQADFMMLSTHRAGFRVLVIHPAEALHPAAANALLKTLEEPPPATLIVLVSDRPALVIATIRSRCRDVSLAAPAREGALRWLRDEGVEEGEAALAHAGGSPLFARELSAPEETALRRRVMAELARPEGADALAFSAGIDREALERTVYWMQTWVQDLVRLRCGCEQRYHVDLGPAAKAKARGADPDRLFDLDRELLAARALVSHPLNARLVAEHLMMTYNQATSGSGKSEPDRKTS